MDVVVGVMGSSEGPFLEGAIAKMQRLGTAVAARHCILITGACPGLSYETAQTAYSGGAIVVGISPALSRQEHITRYSSPVNGFSLLIYTGSGLMGREIENIRSSDIVIIAGGRSGTLGEFAIAYDEGKLIGVLQGTGGIADAVADLVALCNKETGAVILYDDDPEQLLDRLLDYRNGERGQQSGCDEGAEEGAAA